jgi:hypothetical protein
VAETVGDRPDLIDELESHLRDAVQQLVREGHAEHEALTLAMSRLGSPEALAAEFAKVNPGACWLPVRVVLGTGSVLAAGFIGFLLAKFQDGRFDQLLTVHVIAVTLGYTATLLAGILSASYVLARPFRDLNPGQIRSVARSLGILTWVAAMGTALGIVLGTCWAKDHLGRYWAWDAVEIGAALILVWDVVMIVFWWRWSANQHTGILLGLVGDVVVSVGWFGAGAAVRQSHNYLWLVLFIFSQAALFGAGFAPAGCLRRRGA